MHCSARPALRPSASCCNLVALQIKMTTGDHVVHTPAEEVDRMLSAILPLVDRLAGPQPPQDHFIDGPLLQPHPYRGPAAAAAASTSVSAAAAATTSAPAAQQQQQQPVGRRIMFSSFDPDVCVELRRRQSRYPVYYLSGCGLYAHADARRTSIPAALSFATEAGMRGVVMPASVLLQVGAVCLCVC
jgi:glycerophosphodiester phosphodiesterase